MRKSGCHSFTQTPRSGSLSYFKSFHFLAHWQVKNNKRYFKSGGASQGVQGVQLHPLILGPGSLNILKILSFAITKSEFAMGMSNLFKISLQSCFYIADI